jgi:hypothetical protein
VLDECEQADCRGEVSLERQRATKCQAGEQHRLTEKQFTREDPVAAVIVEAVLRHPDREVFEHAVSTVVALIASDAMTTATNVDTNTTWWRQTCRCGMTQRSSRCSQPAPS